MTGDILANLKVKESGPLVEALLMHAKTLIKRSRAKISQHYDTWDMQDRVYRGELEPDQEDKDNAQKGRPTKMIMPNTFAQVHTFTSFLFLMYNQNRTFFELLPTGDEDAGTKRKDCEAVIERDLRHNEWNRVLYQHLIDTSRFGLGINECAWTRKTSWANVPSQPALYTANAVSTPIQGASGWREFVKYEGNLVRPISPFRFFPDMNHPLADFQKGEFCGVEEWYSISQLKDLEKAGEVEGIDHIEPLASNWQTDRGAATRLSLDLESSFNWKDTGSFSGSNLTNNALVTKVQVWLVPSRFKYDGEKQTLGPEEFPILYHLWYANDNRVIRLEPAGWWHNEFGWTVAQFTPDMHRTINLGLADLIGNLQNVISWYINAHITSVRRVMQNRLIVDPRIVDTVSLDGEKDIYLRKGVSVPLERAVGQLRVQDTTGQHMNDVQLLGSLMELVTGVNGNAMGQYNAGRRSAQEARVVTAGAAGRMKLHGHLIWECSLGRLGRHMLSNSRQSLTAQSFKWIVGGGVDPAAFAERFNLFKGTPEEIICGDDFMTFDSTLSSEKGFMAQSIQELFSVVLSSNPMVAQQLLQKIDPVKMLDEMFYLRGSGNVSRFYHPAGQGPMVPPPQLLPAAPGAAVAPAQQPAA